jgi:hypothetical protein
MRLSVLASWCGAALAASAVPPVWFSGAGPGDAAEWTALLNTARAQFAPSPTLQDVTMLYTPEWNGMVEGPTWGAWWTQNSYGTTLAALPWLPEPHRSFIMNANAMWFLWEGNGTIVGRDDPKPAPDGCLCDDATPSGADYKQGDGNVPIHDWALEETLSGVVMQAEQLLTDRSDAATLAYYLPLFNRTLNLIESRREPSNNLFYSGDASNLLAPSYGAWLLPNGTRAPAFLTGMSVSYCAALDRVIELELLAGGVWTALAAQHVTRRESTLAGLPALLAPAGDYFAKQLDPNGTMHGVLGQAQHGYIEAVANHDAVALDVADRVRPGLGEAIMARLLGPTVPVNPVTGGPGLRPYSLVITNAGGLDDMEYDDSSWLWSYGTWVNGGEWATCEARMMLAYSKTGRTDFALDSMRALMGFASIFRMDSPLVEWGSAVYQPDDPINIVYDMFAVPAALIRGLFDPSYTATTLTLTPHVPGNLTSLSQLFPIRWGPHNFYVSTSGVCSSGITSVTMDGAPFANFTSAAVTFTFAGLPATPSNMTVTIIFGAGTADAGPPHSGAAAPKVSGITHATSVRALRALMPTDADLWLDASKLTVANGSPVALWPDVSGKGNDATQATTALQPVFSATGADGNPAVVFDGVTTFLSNAVMALPSRSTIFAVFRDRGTTNLCCTGVFFSVGGCNGLGTKADPSNDDADASVLMIDWSGSPDSGTDDIRGRLVVASVLYNSTGAYSFADTCSESQDAVVGAAGTGYMVGSRNNEDDRFLNGTISEIIVYARPLNASEMEAVHAYLLTKWPTTAPRLRCSAPLPNCTLPAALAANATRLTRFVSGMRGPLGQFADSRYELAHALLALDSVAAWQARCAGLADGSIPELASRSSEIAADASYVASAGRLASGLAAVLDSYSTSGDKVRQTIYALWVASRE